MPPPRIVLANTAPWSLEWNAPERPNGNGTAQVVGPEGTPSTAHTLTVAADATNTTTTAVARVGETTLALASTAGLVVGRRYQLGAAPALGGQVVRVARVDSGTQVTLVRGLLGPVASGATLASLHVAASCPTALTTPARNYRVVWEWEGADSIERPPLGLPFDVARYWPLTRATVADVQAIDPQAAKLAPPGTWWPELLEVALEQLLVRLAGRIAPGALVGAIDLTGAHCYYAMGLCLEAGVSDDRTGALADRMMRRAAAELEAVLAQAPIDANQDGRTSSTESKQAAATLRTIGLRRG